MLYGMEQSLAETLATSEDLFGRVQDLGQLLMIFAMPLVVFDSFL